MNNHNRFLNAISTVMILMIVTVLSIVVFSHEKAQELTISELRNQVAVLKQEINSKNNTSLVEYSDFTYNYLAIGNSITLHDECAYWWNEDGMAASSASNDYFHLVTDYLKENYGDVRSYAYNFSVWEEQATDRAETLKLLDVYLDLRIDLITIQLSENASDINAFEEDYVELIKYIQDKCPNAQIIIIDDFWDNSYKSTIKEKVALDFRISFVSLSDIKGDSYYQCGLGSVVFDDEGNPHTVEHEGVAVHPNDLGMKYIASAVIKAIYS